MSNYIFYFDESFHTRNISKSSIKDTDYFNSYISTGLGFKIRDKYDILNKYENFEATYKKIYTTNEELKSDIVKQKNYISGIASFNKNACNLYYDYFKILNENEIIYYVSIIDKLEYLLLNCSYQFPKFINIKAMIYSIVKLINTYKPENIIEDIMNKDSKLIDDLKDFLKKQIEVNGNIPLKESENSAMKNIYYFLESIDSSKIKFEFEYAFTYQGFKKMINELGIKNVHLVIDKEGSNKILNAAKKEGFRDSEQLDSKLSTGVRMSDMFCGFIARMMRAIYKSTYNDPTIPYEEKHLLPIEWFNLKKESFGLYKEVAKFIKKYVDVYYGTYCSLYSDLFTEFVALVYYFDKFENFDKYDEVKTEQHFKDCNNEMINRVAKDIKRIEKSYF